MSNSSPIFTSVPWRKTSDLRTLVENRTTYSLNSCELNIFETHQKADQVKLDFPDLVLTTMLKGKKVMHLFEKDGFDYLPGESVIVPPNELMKIDFPEASLDNPTQCIALSISNEMISSTFDMLNERYPEKQVTDDWGLDLSYFHLINNRELSEIINRFIKIGVKEKSREKDAIASLALKELLIRLTQTQAREILEKTYQQKASNNRMAFVLDYIKQNLREDIKLDQLAEKACLSKAQFIRVFKNELGMSPIEFVLNERLKMAKQLLKTTDLAVKEVCYMTGFNNPTYFIRAFKQTYGITPGSFA